jgi:WD40 repeat protein/serine/threonine protein kinase
MKREEAIFEEALALTSAEARGAYLREACAGDAALRGRVEELLAAHQDAGALEFLRREDRTRKVETRLVEGGLREQPGDRIGRYRLLQPIGEGGCGVVYLAEQQEPVRRRVALKVIKLGMDTKSVIARFEAERQALALMDHPNIAKVYDAGATETGRPYFVMELVRGVRITEYCEQNHLSTPERLALFVQVCHAIQHAHQKGIIHRDIKPSNILVMRADDQPVPKVIDFGIAKATAPPALTDKTLYTAFEQFIGTPAYMSPEQAGRSGLDIDTRSDLYSLGVLLYELLTGRTPFDTRTLLAAGWEEMRRVIREQEPARPSTRLTQELAQMGWGSAPGWGAAVGASPIGQDQGPRGEAVGPPSPREASPRGRGQATPEAGEVPGGSGLRKPVEGGRRQQLREQIKLVRGDLDWIVMKCLEKDRTRRYETANALAGDIEHHLSHEPVAARPPSTAYRVQKFIRRNQVVVAAASLVVLALVLGLAGSLWQFHAAQSARREAEAHTYAADMNLAQQALEAGDLGYARTLLDRYGPGTGRAHLRGWEWRFLWQECRSDALGELCRLSKPAFRVAYSPDASRLAIAGYRREFIEIWDVPARRRIATLQTNTGGLVAFSPQGNLLATDSRQGTHWIINIWRVGTTDRPFQITNSARPVVLKFSPDGARLASLNRGGHIAMWTVEGWSPLPDLEAPKDWNDEGGMEFSPDGQRLAVGDDGGAIRIFDLTTGETHRTIKAHPQLISALAWSPQAPILASGSAYAGGPILLWDPNTGEPAGELEGHTGWICQLLFSVDGRLLYSASADQTIRIWDVETQKLLATLRGSTDEVYSLALSPDGKTLASGSKDGVVAFWSALPGERRQPVRQSLAITGWYSFAPDGRSFVAPVNGSLRVYELPGLRTLERLSALGTNVSSGAHSPDGTWIACGTSNGWVRVWSRAERRLVGEFCAGEGDLVVPWFLPDGRLVVEDGQGVLSYWAPRTWQRLASFAAPKGHSYRVSSDGRVALTLDGARQLTWWDTINGKLLATTSSAHRLPCWGYAFSPDAQVVASVSEDNSVALWEAATFKLMAAFRAHRNGAFGVAFSPDGRRLVTGGSGSDSIKLWDVATRRQLLSFSEQVENSVIGVGFSADGSCLAGWSWPGKVYLYRAPSWEEIATAEVKEATAAKQP